MDAMRGALYRAERMVIMKTLFRVSEARAFPRNSHTNQPVMTADEITNLASDASLDAKIILETEDKAAAYKRLEEMYSSADITAGTVGYQIDIYLSIVETVEIDDDGDEDFIGYDCAPFDKDVYYANTYHGPKLFLPRSYDMLLAEDNFQNYLILRDKETHECFTFDHDLDDDDIKSKVRDFEMNDLYVDDDYLSPCNLSNYISFKVLA